MKLFVDVALTLVRWARWIGASPGVNLVLNMLHYALLFKIVVKLQLRDGDGDRVDRMI